MTLRTRLLAALSYILLLAIVAFGVPLALSLRARVNAEVRTQAQSQDDLLAATAADLLATSHRPALLALARAAAASVRGRVLIVDAAGNVLADSAGRRQVGVSYESRPEIEAALDGRAIQVQRASRTLGQQILQPPCRSSVTAARRGGARDVERCGLGSEPLSVARTLAPQQEGSNGPTLVARAGRNAARHARPRSTATPTARMALPQAPVRAAHSAPSPSQSSSRSQASSQATSAAPPSPPAANASDQTAATSSSAVLGTSASFARTGQIDESSSTASRSSGHGSSPDD